MIEKMKNPNMWQHGPSIQYILERSASLGSVAYSGGTTNLSLPSSDQVWFSSAAWQAREREADEDIAAGRVSKFDNVEDFLNSL
jgi:hypothetical protein